jgi:hypothetical protein
LLVVVGPNVMGVGLFRDVPRTYVLIGPLSAGTLSW